MKVFSLGCILVLAAGVPMEHAEAAKRFGGGLSFGKMFSTPKKVAPTPQKAPSSTTTTSGKTTSPTAKPGMGGIFGGLLAGGLLGALFFGGAFDGIQIMDILLIALVGYILFSLFARSKQTTVRQPQYEGAGDAGGAQPTAVEPQAFDTSGLLGGGLAEAAIEYPAWFNKEAFLDGARQHFETLQQAWGRNDLSLIETYCHPEFYQLLLAERAKLGEENVTIEVVSVMAEILGLEERDGEAQLSVNFYGWLREGDAEQTTEFNEIWHLTRDTRTSGADWFLVGIEQP